jgi:hypothetical protein
VSCVEIDASALSTSNFLAVTQISARNLYGFLTGCSIDRGLNARLGF